MSVRTINCASSNLQVLLLMRMVCVLRQLPLSISPSSVSVLQRLAPLATTYSLHGMNAAKCHPCSFARIHFPVHWKRVHSCPPAKLPDIACPEEQP